MNFRGDTIRTADRLVAYCSRGWCAYLRGVPSQGWDKRDENAGKSNEDGRIREIARWRANEPRRVPCRAVPHTTPRHAALHSCSCKTKMSWARIVSAAQLAAAVAIILRILFASADPIAYTDDQTYEQTTYTAPVSSTENDSDVYRGKCNHKIDHHDVFE